LIDCGNKSSDNSDLIAAATMQVGQDTFEDCGISDHEMAVYLVAQYLYERAPYHREQWETKTEKETTK